MQRIFIILILSFQLSGCVAALGVAAIGGAAMGITMIANYAREQYPDIDFEQPAPTEVGYRERFDTVWNSIIDTLNAEGERIEIADKSSGILRTTENNLNDVSWFGKGMGKSTFLYSYNIIVRQKGREVSVQTSVRFLEEKAFFAKKEKNLPEGSNMMRHIFYRNLAETLNPAWEKKPDVFGYVGNDW